jgi:hypothetical protein
MEVDNNNGGQQWHERLGSRLQQGRTRAGGKRQQRQRSGDDGCCGGRQQRQMTTVAVAGGINSKGGCQLQQTMTAANDNGTQDLVADYDGEGHEQAVNNKSIMHKAI